MLRERFLTFLFILVLLHDSSCVIKSLYDTGEEIWKLYSMIDKIEFNTNTTFDELFISNNGLHEDIKIQLRYINERINEVEEPMSFGVTRQSLKLSPYSIILSRDLDIVEIFVQCIDKSYEEFHRYITAVSYSDEKFRSFLQRMTMNIEGAILVLRRTLADDEVSSGRKNFVSLIGDYANSQRAKMCNGPQMLSSILVQLFKTIMLAEMKNNLMVSFTNIYRFIRETDQWKWMNLVSRVQFEQQFAVYVHLFGINLIESDLSYVRSCDPENGTWTRNELFYELEGTIQATIFRYYWPPCKYFSCNTIWLEKAHECRTQYHSYRSVCPSDLVQCKYLGAVEACQLRSGPFKFQYVNSTELGLLGRDSECPNDNADLIKDGSGLMSSRRICACNCYGDRNKVSLAIIESNVDGNMVITGIRFVQRDRILYIQPREGKLINNGHILRYSEKWVSIPQNIEESDLHNVERMNRVFFLDDVHLPFNYVLTGIKFSIVQRKNVRGIAIVIFGSPFDYTSGKINNDERFRISNQEHNSYPGNPLLFTAVSSVYTNSTHVVSPEYIKYVSLERSTLKDDFGQSTLPLFDAVPVRSYPSSPLGGIGIFHKGVEGFAGFLSLRMYGINYADYFIDFESEYLEDGRVKFNHSYYH